MWYRNTKWANAVENGTDRLAQCRDATRLQFVKKKKKKKAITVKHNKVKLNKPQRYDCLLSRKKSGKKSYRWYDSFYVKCPEKQIYGDSEWIYWWLLGLVEVEGVLRDGEWPVMSTRFPSRGTKIF